MEGVWEVRRGENWGENGEGMKALEISGEDDTGATIRSVTARVVATRQFYEERQGCKFSHPEFRYGAAGRNRDIYVTLMLTSTLLLGRSLTPFPPQKPNDPTCHRRPWNSIRHAQIDGKQ